MKIVERIDFTNCKRVIGRAYNGANGKKIAIEYQGVPYMLKFPPAAGGRPTELSYTNSCISEHIASSIFNMLGIDAQKTRLGTFEIKGKTKVVCACRDFVTEEKILYDFCSIKNTVIDSEHGGSGTELSELLETIEMQQFVTPNKLLSHFWNVFVVDALLGNFDRHNGNWGFLFDKHSQSYELAPVFDCGSCLLPQADESVMEKVLEKEEELNARIYRFPNSAVKEGGSKINYHDFLMAAEYAECNEALLRIMPRIRIDDIVKFIDDIPYISDLQRRFYKTYITARYDRIIVPAYERLMR